LAEAGKEVHFLLHSDYDFVAQHGLRVDSVRGDFHLKHPSIYKTTADMPLCDVVLVCLKTTHNELLKELLPPLIHKDTLVVLIQNGLGIESDLADTFPNLSIAGGLAFICSGKVGEGHIVHSDLGKISIGGYGFSSSPELEAVCADMVQSGIPADISPDLMLMRWRKLVWNIPFNGMTVVLNTTTDKLMSCPQTHELSYQLMLEVVAGANACGVALTVDFAQKMMAMTEKMTPYSPSMKLDFDYNRPLEIEYIYTRPLLEASRRGCDMPRISMLEKQLRFLTVR
jgi:2-dehydropantoate 2-reductase